MKRIGKTIEFERGVYIKSWASAVGKKEGEGPLAKDFDIILDDDTAGEKSWEKAESRLVTSASTLALEKGSTTFQGLCLAVGGDLLNQCVATTFAMRESQTPYLGLYGACSTMAEGLIVGSSLIDGGGAENVLATASSHFCSAERQYRSPIEYGGQRTPTAQWTVTGAGAVVLTNEVQKIRVTHATIGKICDLGVKDASNMGAAMAPAAYDTITQFFADTGTCVTDYDLIVSGDLGVVGRDIVMHLFEQDGIEVRRTYNDCGCMIFSGTQDTHSGGSGCGCSASVLSSHILKEMAANIYKSVLFCGTGALLSPTTSFQGESIPGICHLVALSVV